MADPIKDKPASEDFAALFAESERGGRRGRPTRYAIGDRVKGKLLSVGRDVAVIDLEAGGEGTLDVVELRDESGQMTVQVGEIVEARVVAKGDKDGVVTLRRAAARGMEARASLGQFASSGLPVEGAVTGVNKGGLEVNVAGLRAFCPISQIDVRQVADASLYVGQKLLFRITKYDEEDRRGPNVVLSRRALLEEEGRARASETRATLAVGAVISGVVTSIKDFGAFVDSGGLDGLLPASEIGFQRGSRPSDLLAVGQAVTVQILRIEKRDATKRPASNGPSEQITLSLKSLERDPWDDAVAQLTPGRTVKGKVTRAEAFGAFVEVIPGVEGLLHISELGAGKMLRHARDAAKPGDAMDVTVISVDREKRRIPLSLASDEDRIDDEGRAAATRAGSSSGMGTFADIMRKGKGEGKGLKS
ncbi:MAG: S1 RNA-binding domain-containing protein [Deltaproteobacteria bacterium]|nr:S1 RNA-binding domain-containing protein [Deltaproteobacteria bacterium]